MRFLMGEMGHVPRLAKCFAANLEAIPTSAMKVQAIFLAARHLPPGDQRDKLLQLAAELRSGCVMSYFFDDPAYLALREIAQYESLQEGELDKFTFACLKQAPDSYMNRGMIDSFGSLAKLLVFRDPVLARKFLQSAIDVDGWHAGVEYPSRFSNNELLKTAAWIDPEYACEVAETLAKRWDRQGPTNKLQLYSDMIQALNQVRLAID
jgi:hypothetical protein